jgi:hypothetical protein
MVTARLDVLVRALGTASRRDGVRLLAAGVLGGRLAWLNLTGEAKKKKKKCKGSKKNCGKKCIPKNTCCAQTDCAKGSGQVCLGDVCGCPTGEQDSGGVCGQQPSCAGTFYLGGCSVDGDCCSNQCFAEGNLCFGCVAAGQPCYVSDECCNSPTPLTCRGFVCVAD